jgi:hypothetical protein
MSKRTLPFPTHSAFNDYRREKNAKFLLRVCEGKTRTCEDNATTFILRLIDDCLQLHSEFITNRRC